MANCDRSLVAEHNNDDVPEENTLLKLLPAVQKLFSRPKRVTRSSMKRKQTNDEEEEAVVVDKKKARISDCKSAKKTVGASAGAVVVAAAAAAAPKPKTYQKLNLPSKVKRPLTHMQQAEKTLRCLKDEEAIISKMLSMLHYKKLQLAGDSDKLTRRMAEEHLEEARFQKQMEHMLQQEQRQSNNAETICISLDDSDDDDEPQVEKVILKKTKKREHLPSSYDELQKKKRMVIEGSQKKVQQQQHEQQHEYSPYMEVEDEEGRQEQPLDGDEQEDKCYEKITQENLFREELMEEEEVVQQEMAKKEEEVVREENVDDVMIPEDVIDLYSAMVE